MDYEKLLRLARTCMIYLTENCDTLGEIDEVVILMKHKTMNEVKVGGYSENVDSRI